MTSADAYRSARDACALADLPDRAVLAATGPEAAAVPARDPEQRHRGARARARLPAVPDGREGAPALLLPRPGDAGRAAARDAGGPARRSSRDTLEHYRVAAPVRFAARPTRDPRAAGPAGAGRAAGGGRRGGPDRPRGARHRDDRGPRGPHRPRRRPAGGRVRRCTCRRTRTRRCARRSTRRRSTGDARRPAHRGRTRLVRPRRDRRRTCCSRPASWRSTTSRRAATSARRWSRVSRRAAATSTSGCAACASPSPPRPARSCARRARTSAASPPPASRRARSDRDGLRPPPRREPGTAVEVDGRPATVERCPSRAPDGALQSAPMKIYTRTGDRGETGLLGGVRVPKDHLRVAAYGEVDETNAVLGVVLAHSRVAKAQRPAARHPARPVRAGRRARGRPARRQGTRRRRRRSPKRWSRGSRRRSTPHERGLPPLRAFILPGGTPPGAHAPPRAHRLPPRGARRRRAAPRTAKVDPLAIVYLNRLSDLLFVLARYENARAGEPEETW